MNRLTLSTTLTLATLLPLACAPDDSGLLRMDEINGDELPPPTSITTTRSTTDQPPDLKPTSQRATPTRALWALVHPSYAPPLGAGIFLYDLQTGELLRHLVLPASALSPHALTDDGESLWLGAFGYQDGIDLSSVYRLDRQTGAVLERREGIRTEGLAFDGQRVWVGSEAFAQQVEVAPLDGEAPSLAATNIISDLTSDGDSFYYVANDANDPIVRLERDGQEHTIVPSAARGQAPYALAHDGEHLLLADAGVVRRFDPRTGAEGEPLPFLLQGWVTALELARD